MQIEPVLTPSITFSDGFLREAGTNKISLIGTFHQYNVPRFPFQAPPFVVTVAITNLRGKLDHFKISVRVEDKSSGFVIASAAGEINSPVDVKPTDTVQIPFVLVCQPFPSAVVDRDAAELPRLISGFFTLSLVQFESRKVLSEKLAKKMPTMVPAYLLGRMATETSIQRTGIGKMMMKYLLQRIHSVEESVGGIGVFVDAKDDTAAGFYSQFGFIKTNDTPLRLFLPMETIRKAMLLANKGEFEI